MIIKQEDIKRIIEILKQKEQELKPGEVFKFNGKEIILEDDFVLPEKWALKLTKENNEEAGIYRGDTPGRALLGPDWTISGYIMNYNGLKGYWNVSIKEEYIEITTEQFRKYILNK